MRIPGLTAPTLLVACLGAVAPVAAQQSATVRTAENFRREPNGELLARVEEGTRLPVVSRGNGWIEAELEGWVWLRSLQATERQGFDLVVSQGGGENLRAAPQGAILGHLQEGTLLEELDRDPAWVHVRRRGWIWEPSVELTQAAPAQAPASPPASSTPPAQFTGVGSAGGSILSAPDGDTLAVTAPGTQVQVVAREGSWARVRLEGWTWLPPGAATATADTTAVLAPADLVGDPEANRGKVVSWSLQFISLEHAEKVRTDFFEGEPFILARYGDADGPFVYVAVPSERLAEVQGLAPLEHIVVTGRVRTGASVLTGTPILDLLAMERVRDAG